MTKTRAQARMLKAVGLVADQAAQLEQELRELICCFLRSPHGHTITAGDEWARLVDMTYRLANYSGISDDEFSRLDRLLKAADELRVMRNHVVHARWESMGNGRHAPRRSQRVSRKPRGPAFYGGGDMTHEDALRLAELIGQAADEVQAYRSDVFEAGVWVPPFPRGFRILPDKDGFDATTLGPGSD